MPAPGVYGCCRCRGAGSFLQSQVAADDSFNASMFGAQQQGAVVVERFRTAPELALADADGYFPAKCVAVFFPFVGYRCESPGRNPRIIVVQLRENVRLERD